MITTIQLILADTTAELVLVPPPGRPPTLDHTTLDQLDAHLATIERAGDAIRLVILRSASATVFCAGANLNVLQHLNPTSIVPWVEHGHRVLNRLESLPCPVLARIEGFALGGGLEIALAADLIFVTPNAQLAQTEAKLGFVAGWGGSWRLPRRVGAARAKELFFTGRRVTGSEAVAIGLADECVPPAEMAARCAQLAQEIATCSPIAIRQLKCLVDASPQLPRAASAAAEAAASITCLQHPDTQHRVTEFLNRRKKTAPAPAQ